MRLKFKIVFDILLILASLTILVYNFSAQRRIAYLSSIIAVFGTSAYMVRDMMALKRKK